MKVKHDKLLSSFSFNSNLRPYSVARIQLLEHAARKLGLQCRMRVVAEGDPANGHQAVFVAVLG